MLSTVRKVSPVDCSETKKVHPVDITQVQIMLPQPVKFPRIGSIESVNYGTWWWYDVSELKKCILEVMVSQGYHSERPGVVRFDPNSFRPKHEFDFTWLLKVGNKTELVISHIDDCHFGPFRGEQVYVPCGWGAAVAAMVREHGVVAILDNKNHNRPPQFGRRWSNEILLLNGIRLGWYR